MLKNYIINHPDVEESEYDCWISDTLTFILYDGIGNLPCYRDIVLYKESDYICFDQVLYWLDVYPDRAEFIASPHCGFEYTKFVVSGWDYFIPHLTEAHEHVTWEQFVNSVYNYVDGELLFKILNGLVYFLENMSPIYNVKSTDIIESRMYSSSLNTDPE